MTFSSLTGIALTSLASFSTPAFAADVGRSAALVGMGGVGAAAPRDNAAISLNPGLLGLTDRYDFQGLFGLGPSGGLHWGASGMDARTSDYLAGGIAYTGDTYEPPLRPDEVPGWIEAGSSVTNRKRLHDLAIGAGVPLLERRLSLGLTTNIGWFNNDRQGKGVGVDLGAGLGLRPLPPLVLGVAARNLLPLGKNDRPLSVVGGIRAEAPKVGAVEANVEWVQYAAARDELPIALAGGVELPLGVARLRAGARRDADRMPSFTAGLGWENEGAALEYGLTVPLKNPSLAATTHVFSIRFAAPVDIDEPR